MRDGGQREAEARFRRLFAETFAPVLGYVLRRVNPVSDAADVVAETFLVAWRRIDDVPPDGAARPWLFGVARRVLANHARGERRRSSLAARLQVDLALTLPDHAVPSAEAAAVAAAMRELDELDRELLHLSCWESLTPAEIAIVLGIAPATARSRLHRARVRLRGLLLAHGWAESADGERVLAIDPGRN